MLFKKKIVDCLRGTTELSRKIHSNKCVIVDKNCFMIFGNMLYYEMISCRNRFFKEIKEMSNKLSDSQIVKRIRSYQILIALKILLPFFAIIVPFLLLIFNDFTELITDYTKFLIVSAIILVITIIFACIGKNWDKKLKLFVGENITKDVLSKKIDIIKYVPNNFMNQDFIKKCMILPKYDRINGSDYISGTYKGVKFTYCDLHMEWADKEREDGRTRTTYRTNFKGPLITIDLGQKIEGYVRIKERKTPRKEKNFLSDVFSGAADVLDIKTENNIIEVESVEFNNQFEIKSTNDQMAFYILTPDFLESIVKADELAQGYTNIEFRGKDAVITINNGVDSFELNKTIYNKNRLEKSRQTVRNDLNRVLGIIDKILEKDKLF